MFSNKDYVYCVYKERSFSKAADKLYISQPSLSATIAKVEKKLGTKIFDRKTKPISLTPFGVEYIREIERIYDIEEYLQALACDVHTLQSGSLAVGASNLSISSFVPKAVVKFKENFPNVHVELVDISTIRSSHMLDSGDLDMVITYWPYDSSKYTREICSTEHLILVIPQKFPINDILQPRMLTLSQLADVNFSSSETPCVSISEVRQIPFILPRQTSSLRQGADMIFKAGEVEPKVVLETDYSAIAYNLASMGMGATIVSNQLAIAHPANNTLCHYRINSQYCMRNSYICYSRGRYLTPAMRKFIEILRAET